MPRSRRGSYRSTLQIGGAIVAAFFVMASIGEQARNAPGLTVSAIPTLAPKAAYSPDDFDEAKRLLRMIYQEDLGAEARTDAYCGCPIANDMRSIPEGNCGIAVTVHQDRAYRVEWEHVIPASHFGQQRPCWRDAPPGTSGREHCGAVDPDFRMMEADPHNLLPASGALNAIRSNHPFGEVPGEERAFGVCNFEFAEGSRYVEPPDEIKGDIARIHFYFRDRYRFKLSAGSTKLYEAWAAMDPLSGLERARIAAVERRTGMMNSYGLPAS